MHKQDLTVYPNPGEGLFHVDISEFKGQNIQMEVYSTEGRVIFGNRILAESQVYEINIQNNPPGMYFLKVIPDDGLPMTSKLISVK